MELDPTLARLGIAPWHYWQAFSTKRRGWDPRGREGGREGEVPGQGCGGSGGVQGMPLLNVPKVAKLSLSLSSRTQSLVSGGLTLRSPHSQGRLAELPQKGLLVGCEVAGREVLMIHNTRHRGERREGGGGGERGDGGEKERPPARPVARRRLGS